MAYEQTKPDRDPEIAILDLESGRKETIIRNSYNDNYPTWSPDGAEIAFERDFVAEGGSYRSDIFAVRPDGSGLRNITGDPHVDEGAPRLLAQRAEDRLRPFRPSDRPGRHLDGKGRRRLGLAQRYQHP